MMTSQLLRRSQKHRNHKTGFDLRYKRHKQQKKLFSVLVKNFELAAEICFLCYNTVVVIVAIMTSQSRRCSKNEINKRTNNSR